MTIFRILLIILAFLASIAANSALVDPSIKWNVFETENFEIIHDAKQAELAEHYLKWAEVFYKNSSKVFPSRPDKVTMILQDNLDSANGSATFLPDYIVRLNAALPNELDIIGIDEDWAKVLMFHELVHILNFHPANGIYTPFRYLLGSVVRPNAVLPLWWQEGLAVYIETYFSEAGRLRSPSYASYLRALTLENKFSQETLPRINESSLPWWPYGQRPYFFGSLMWNEILKDKDVSLAGKLNENYGRRIPFLLNGPLEEKTGKNYSEFLQQTIDSAKNKSKRDIATILKAKDKTPKVIGHSGTGHHSPVISPNGQYMIYLAHVPKRSPELRLLKRGKDGFRSSTIKVLNRGTGTNKVSWHKNSKLIVYDQLVPHKRFYNFRDLYTFDIETKKKTRLTFGARAHEPEFSPNGKKVVYAKRTPTGTSLYELNLKSKKSKLLLSGGFQVRISRPTYLNKNKILFTHRDINGQTSFKLFDKKSKKIRTVLSQFKDVGHPKKTKKGLLFISKQSGVGNLYLAQKNLKTAVPVTNTLTKISNGEFDHRSNTFYVAQLTANGSQISTQKGLVNSAPPMVEPVYNGNGENLNLIPSLTYKKKSYSSFKYLVPTYVLPTFYLADEGILFQAVTSAGDPLGYQGISAFVSAETGSPENSWGLSYANGASLIDYSLQYAESTTELISSNSTYKDRLYSAGAGFNLTSSDNWRTNLKATAVESSGLISNTTLTRTGPSVSVSYSNSSPLSSWFSGPHSVSAAYTHYSLDSGLKDYGQTTGVIGKVWTTKNKRRFIKTSFKGTFADKIPNGFVDAFGTKTANGNYVASLDNAYVMRGYPSSGFLGRALINTNLELHFPLADIYKGVGTFPFFLKNVTASIFADGISTNGFAFSTKEETYIRTNFDYSYWSTGIELHWATSVAYHVPLSFTIGIHYGIDEDYGSGLKRFFNFTYGSIGDLSKAKKTY